MELNEYLEEEEMKEKLIELVEKEYLRSSAIGIHWNGVKGFGINGFTLSFRVPWHPFSSI